MSKSNDSYRHLDFMINADLSKFLNENKIILMGIATILVVLYHAYCRVDGYGIFKYGYIGVDFFLLLSGFGLSYAYNKYNVAKFIGRRFMRIYPAYLLSVLGLFIIFESFDIYYGWTDYLLHAACLTYYKCELLEISNWYISVYLTMCLLFPLLYLMIDKFKHWALLSITALVIFTYCFCIKTGVTINAQYDCGFGRIPIILLGIYLYQRPAIKIHTVWLLALAVFSIFVMKYLSVFLATTLIVPILLITAQQLPKIKIPERIVKCIEILGKYSLEIYLGNCVALSITGIIFDRMDQTSINTFELSAMYFAYTLLFAVAIILLLNLPAYFKSIITRIKIRNLIKG